MAPEAGPTHHGDDAWLVDQTRWQRSVARRGLAIITAGVSFALLLPALPAVADDLATAFDSFGRAFHPEAIQNYAFGALAAIAAINIALVTARSAGYSTPERAILDAWRTVAEFGIQLLAMFSCFVATAQWYGISAPDFATGIAVSVTVSALISTVFSAGIMGDRVLNAMRKTARVRHSAAAFEKARVAWLAKLSDPEFAEIAEPASVAPQGHHSGLADWVGYLRAATMRSALAALGAWAVCSVGIAVYRLAFTPVAWHDEVAAPFWALGTTVAAVVFSLYYFRPSTSVRIPFGCPRAMFWFVMVMCGVFGSMVSTLLMVILAPQANGWWALGGSLVVSAGAGLATWTLQRSFDRGLPAERVGRLPRARSWMWAPAWEAVVRVDIDLAYRRLLDLHPDLTCPADDRHYSQGDGYL